ncbi:MAG: pseudouridine synthase [Gammaproteobacteria bacterium]
MTLTLLHLDDVLVAIDKPPGLLVHRSTLDAHETRNALDLLRAQLGIRLWTVHRLDKATSGVLMFARSPEAARALSAAFETGAVVKRYLALVRGWPPDTGEIDYALARDPERPSADQARLPSLTRFRVLARHEWPFGDGRHASSRYALVEVSPMTGRRHQIRRHFKHLAHPVIGDSTHGKGAHNRAVARWLGVSRLWLHAAALGVPAFDGRPPVRIEAAAGGEWNCLWPRDAPRGVAAPEASPHPGVRRNHERGAVRR